MGLFLFLLHSRTFGLPEASFTDLPLVHWVFAGRGCGIRVRVLAFVSSGWVTSTILNKNKSIKRKDHFKNKYKTKLVTLPTIVTDTWTIITNGVIKNRDTQDGLLYLYKIYPKNMGKPHFYCFKIFEHILDLVGNYSDMLTKGSSASENDYIRVVWSNIFEQLFRPKTNVSVITGETVNPISTLNRKEQYDIKQDTKKEKEKNIIGFKIDIRLTYNKDCSKYSCIDLCAGEAAKEEDKSKTATDQCKVVREAKDNLDVLLSVLPNSSDACVGWCYLFRFVFILGCKRPLCECS